MIKLLSKFMPFWWWSKRYKSENKNTDDMMDTEQWREAMKSPSNSGEDNVKAGGISALETRETPKFVSHQDANPKQLTFDGCHMEAAMKVGGRGWLVFVKEDGGYGLRSDAECGGPSYTKDVVENLPRVGKGDNGLLMRELDALKDGKKSSFLESIGMVQHPSWYMASYEMAARY